MDDSDPRTQAEREFAEGKLTRSQFLLRLLGVGLPFATAVSAAGAMRSDRSRAPAQSAAQVRAGKEGEAGVLLDARSPLVHMEVVATGVDLDAKVAARLAGQFECQLLSLIRRENQLPPALQIAKRKKVKKASVC
jgi:hypothetical protein